MKAIIKAIITKYHGPTEIRGSRISASDCDKNRIYIPYPYNLSGENVYRAAADEFMKKMKWSGKLHGGAVNGGYVFVLEK